jgi:anti-anti-sigma factor
MQFTTYQIESITVVDIKGRIDAASADNLHASLTTLLHEGHIHLIINCLEVEFLSSGGMRAFLLASKDLQKVGGTILYCNFNEIIQEILRLSGMSKYFRHFADLSSALTELKSNL